MIMLVLAAAPGCGVSVGAAAVQRAAEETFPDLVHRAEAATADERWSDAVALWRTVVERNPTDGRFWSGLARSLVETGRLREAIAPYERALELGAGFPWRSAYAIARIHALLRERDLALAGLTRSLDLGYRDLAAVRSDTAFAWLRDEERFRALTGLADVASMSRVEGWRHDLDLLDREIRRLHPAPFRRVGEANYAAAVAALDRDIPRLADDEVTVRLMELTALVGDGHTFFMSMRPAVDGRLIISPPFDAAPVLFFLFGEELYLVGGDPAYAAMEGWRVTDIAGHAAAQVLERLEPLASYDNPEWIRFVVTDLARRPGVLHGLGLAADPDTLRLTLRSADGRSRELTLTTDAAASDLIWLPFPADSSKPLYLRDRSRNYWFTYLAESRSVYFQFNRVMPDPSEPFDRFIDRLFTFVDTNPVDQLIIDMRWNSGGNTFMALPLIQRLAGAGKVNRHGSLFVIIGRMTFSAAQNAATMIEKLVDPIFVGEPTGSAPNFIGETVLVLLPYSGLTASVSDLYWQTSWPMDHRTWIAPLLYAPPTIEAFRAGRDPALEAILEFSQAALAGPGRAVRRQ